MKLQLNKEWFEKRIRPGEDFEVGAGVPLDAAACGDKSSDCSEEESIDEEFVATRVLGRLIELMQRDRRRSVEQLATAASVDIAEIVKIKFDPKYVPHPRSVQSLVRFFDLTERIIFDLSNGIAVNNTQLQDAANRFLANSPDMAELSHEECVAMTELVKFLGTQAND